MLDSLDETFRGGRKLVVEWIQRQILSYARNRFVLTSRPHGYIDTPLDNAIILNVQPFTLKQMESFVRKWYLIDEHIRSSKHDSGVSIRAEEDAKNFFARLYQKPSLVELAANPLLLTMIVTLHSTGGSLPDNRLDLYREIFQVLLYRRREAIGIKSKLTVNQKLEVLQILAFHMLQKHLFEIAFDQLSRVVVQPLSRISADLTPLEFFKDIEQNSALFLELSTDTWSFIHPTLQEYLAATHLKETRKENILIKHIDDAWWHETIRFYCAQADATAIIQACLARTDSSAQLLSLALECNSQKLKADTAVTQHIEQVLQTGIEDSDRTKRSIVAEALLKRRLEGMIYLHDDVYCDSSLMSCAEYQLFLDDQSAQGHYYHPWHWHADIFQPGQGHEPILGVQPLEAQAFCAWLTARANDAWCYRLPRKDECMLLLPHLDKAAYSRSESGFWAEDNEFTWVNEVAPEYKNLEELVRDQLLLDRAKALSYDQVRASDRREPIDDALELERKLNTMQVPDITALLAREIDIHPFILDEAYFLKNSHKSFGERSLFSERLSAPTILDYLRALSKRTSPSYTEQEKRLLWFIRYQCQLQARSAYFWMQQEHPSQKQRSLQRQKAQERALKAQEFAFYRKLCIDFVLLELRTKGKLPAWEGIIVVKERRQNGFS